MGYLLELSPEIRCRHECLNISRHSSRANWAMCLNMLPPHMVWWTPGHVPEDVYGGLPLHNPSMTYICKQKKTTHWWAETWTRHTSLFLGWDHRALIIIERVRQEGEGGGLELQLPASSFLNELLVYSINKCRLFIYYKWMVRIQDILL
jgi:hypothetical protein